MSILVNKETRVLVQGITGREGSFHAAQMIAAGTEVVAGMTPGRGGEWVLDGKVPIFDTVKQAVDVTEVNTSVIFVPASVAADSISEAAEAGIDLIVCITEGIPVKDMIQTCAGLQKTQSRLIGPNCPGIISPGESLVGIIPVGITMPGKIGIISRSGTLTYEILYALKRVNLGVSTCVGIGGDAIKGADFVEILELFEDDPHTDSVILIGEIGGIDEEHAAEMIMTKFSKPVYGFIAGLSAPPGKRMGHAGAIIEGGTGGAQQKIEALTQAGVKVATNPGQVVNLILKK
jgi:succinyl-CoA synthetase alpha subunit